MMGRKRKPTKDQSERIRELKAQVSELEKRLSEADKEVALLQDKLRAIREAHR